MKVVPIPLSKLVTDKENPREKIEEIEELANSLQKNGQEQPCTVEDLGDGRYLLDDGNRRFFAFRLIEKRTNKEPIIQCIIEHNLSSKERLLKRCVIDAQQKNWSVPERDKAWKKLWEVNKGISKIEFSKTLGTNTTKVDNFLDRMELGAEFLDSLEVGSDVISETKALDANTRKKLLKRASDEGLGAREVRVITKTIRDASDTIKNAVVENDLTVEQASKLKGLSLDKQKTAIGNIKTTKKYMDDVPKLVQKGTFKPKTEKDQKILTSQEFVDRLQSEILDTSSQMITIEGVLEEIENQELDQYFTPKMVEALKLSLEELTENVSPAFNRIEKTIKKWSVGYGKK